MTRHLVTSHQFEHQYAVELWQEPDGSLTVAYGHDITRGLSYMDAAAQFGYCVFHAAVCAGELEQVED